MCEFSWLTRLHYVYERVNTIQSDIRINNRKLITKRHWQGRWIGADSTDSSVGCKCVVADLQLFPKTKEWLKLYRSDVFFLLMRKHNLSGLVRRSRCDRCDSLTETLLGKKEDFLRSVLVQWWEGYLAKCRALTYRQVVFKPPVSPLNDNMWGLD